MFAHLALTSKKLGLACYGLSNPHQSFGTARWSLKGLPQSGRSDSPSFWRQSLSSGTSSRGNRYGTGLGQPTLLAVGRGTVQRSARLHWSGWRQPMPLPVEKRTVRQRAGSSAMRPVRQRIRRCRARSQPLSWGAPRLAIRSHPHSRPAAVTATQRSGSWALTCPGAPWRAARSATPPAPGTALANGLSMAAPAASRHRWPLLRCPPCGCWEYHCFVHP